jgi:hypothetical protein
MAPALLHSYYADVTEVEKGNRIASGTNLLRPKALG